MDPLNGPSLFADPRGAATNNFPAGDTRPARTFRTGPLQSEAPWPARSIRPMVSGLMYSWVDKINHAELCLTQPALVAFVRYRNAKPPGNDALCMTFSAGAMLAIGYYRYTRQLKKAQSLAETVLKQSILRTAGAPAIRTPAHQKEWIDQSAAICVPFERYLIGQTNAFSGLALSFAATSVACIAAVSAQELQQHLVRLAITLALAVAILAPATSLPHKMLVNLTGEDNREQTHNHQLRCELERQRILANFPLQTEAQRRAADVEYAKALAELPCATQSQSQFIRIAFALALGALPSLLPAPPRWMVELAGEGGSSGATIVGSVGNAIGANTVLAGFWLMHTAEGRYVPDYVRSVPMEIPASEQT